jgi:hypothetical protein
MSAGYTKSDLQKLPLDANPSRGEWCPCCNVVIPDFADLTEKDKSRILSLIRDNRMIAAIAELKNATGCPLSWAKIWVHHGGKANAARSTAPCPYCGKPLKTALAKQCPHCNMDWHNPDKPKRLGAIPSTPG